MPPEKKFCFKNASTPAEPGATATNRTPFWSKIGLRQESSLATSRQYRHPNLLRKTITHLESFQRSSNATSGPSGALVTVYAAILLASDILLPIHAVW